MHELAAVIVETRRLSLYQVITEHLYYLPKYTKLYIFSTEDNRHLQEMLNCEFHVVEINDIRGYNKLLKSIEFWNKLSNNMSAELVNSPTFNSQNNGFFQFVTDDFSAADVTLAGAKVSTPAPKPTEPTKSAASGTTVGE